MTDAATATSDEIRRRSRGLSDLFRIIAIIMAATLVGTRLLWPLVTFGEHAVAGGHERHLRAQQVVGARELGASHAGAHDDEVLGQGVQVVQLGPGEDAVAIGLGALEHARTRTQGKQNGVGLVFVVAHGNAGGAQEAALAGHHGDAARLQAGRDVLGLLEHQAPDAGVHRRHVHHVLGDIVERGVRIADAQLACAGGDGEPFRSGDDRLGGDHVREDRIASQALPLDERHLRSGLRSDKGRLVTAGSTADDHDAC